MKTNTELKLPRSKKSYYLTILLEISVILLCVIYYYHSMGFMALLVLVGLYIPLRKLFDPMFLVINDNGISLTGYEKRDEELFHKWKEIYSITLHNNGRYHLCELYINFRDSRERLRIDLEQVYDIRDQIYIGRYNKRVRESLKILCKGHGISFYVS